VHLVLFHATKMDFPSPPRPRLKPSGSAYKGLRPVKFSPNGGFVD
jgi:hypothetical protein